MIFVIVPLGKGTREVTGWVIRVILYTLGSMVGATLFALLMGLIGQGLRALLPGVGYEWITALLGVLALVFALKELRIIKLPELQIGWQVPASWMRPSRMLGNTLYGIVLGAGVFTFIPFASFYLLLLWEMSAGAVSLQAALTLGAIYGFFRGLPAVMGGISVLRGAYPLGVSDWLVQRLGLWHAINAIALLLVAGLLLGSFVL
ncbi:MAG TPA: hypothetical protein VLQ48_06390 [Chloroflexia bacterium]|nr:hypothetical protein [Chloroflexia bacterium]